MSRIVATTSSSFPCFQPNAVRTATQRSVPSRHVSMYSRSGEPVARRGATVNGSARSWTKKPAVCRSLRTSPYGRPTASSLDQPVRRVAARLICATVLSGPIRTTPSGNLSRIVSPVIEPCPPPAPGRVSLARRAPSLQPCTRDFNQRPERGRIFHGHVREHPAIHVDLSQLQPIDKSVVRQPVLARGCVDARDPQPTEVALALPAVVV